MSSKDPSKIERNLRRQAEKFRRADAAFERANRRLTKNLKVAGVKASGAMSRKTSGRIGTVDGHLTRPATISVQPAKRAGALARYTHRVDGMREEELESKGGSTPDEFETLATAVEATIPEPAEGEQKRAAAYGITVDLPYGTTKEIRAVIGERVAAQFIEREFPVCWAVHRTNSIGEEHPHLHLVVAAQKAGKRPIDGTDEMLQFRKKVGEIINETHAEMAGERLEIEATGGGLKAVGITRPPKPNLPLALYRQRKKRDELLKSGKRVPAKCAELAEAADRIMAAYDKAVAEGVPPPPRTQAERRAQRDREHTKAVRDGRAKVIANVAKAIGTRVNETFPYSMWGVGSALQLTVTKARRADKLASRVAELEAQYVTGPAALVAAWRRASDDLAAWPEKVVPNLTFGGKPVKNAVAYEHGWRAWNTTTIISRTAEEIFEERRAKAIDAIKEAEAMGKTFFISTAKEDAKKFGVGLMAGPAKWSRGWKEAVEDACKLQEEAEVQAAERELLRPIMDEKEALTKRLEQATAALLGNTEARKIAREAGLKVKGLELPPNPVAPSPPPQAGNKPEIPAGRPRGNGGRGGESR